MSRAINWEQRLAALLLESQQRPFKPHIWNCAKFAHAGAVAVTGEAVPRPSHKTWKGSLEASMDALFPRSPNLAFVRRGDIVVADIPQPTLGICVGAHFASVSETGILEFPISVARVAWRVG